jgi:hypothetical protein
MRPERRILTAVDLRQASIPLEEDARLPLMEAKVENQWQRWRPKYYKSLQASGNLKRQLWETAEQCIYMMNQY